MPENCLLCGNKIEIQKDGYGFCDTCLCYYETEEYRDQINEAFGKESAQYMKAERKPYVVPKICILCEKPIARNINGLLFNSLSGEGWNYDSENFPELCLHGETYYEHRTCRTKIGKPLTKKIDEELDRIDRGCDNTPEIQKRVDKLCDESRKIIADIIRVVNLRRRGFSIRKIASELNINRGWVWTVLKATKQLREA